MMIALSCHCLAATVGTVSLVPPSRCSGLSFSSDFVRATSTSLDLFGFADAFRLPADLCRELLGVLFVVALASQQRQLM